MYIIVARVNAAAMQHACEQTNRCEWKSRSPSGYPEYRINPTITTTTMTPTPTAAAATTATTATSATTAATATASGTTTAAAAAARVNGHYTHPC